MVALIDLDEFKRVNDGHGHDGGDALLVEMARRLAACVRAGDLAARLGGDEFAVISEAPAGGGEPVDPAPLAERLLAALGAPAVIGGVPLQPGVSVGVANFPDDASDSDQLLRNADRALYAAKAAGRGTWRAFASDCVAAADAGPRAPQT